jgi:Tfp pilus assembly protein PilZ
MANKREYKRRIKRTPVIYYSNGKKFCGSAINFPHSGLFIRTRKPFRPGIQLTMSVEVSRDRLICLSGVTVRATRYGFACNKNGMGVKLISHPMEYNDFITALS